MRKTILTICAMVCTFAMCLPSVANATTVTDEQVAEMKARNEAYRATIADEEMGIKSFTVVDTNGDGVHELAVSLNEESQIPHALLQWDGEEVWGAIADGWSQAYNMVYCVETGYMGVTLEPEANNGYFTLKILKWEESEYDSQYSEIELKEDCYYIMMDVNGENYYWNFVSEENKLTENEITKFAGKLEECFPTIKSIDSSYSVTAENLDKVLPIEEEAIRTWIAQGGIVDDKEDEEDTNTGVGTENNNDKNNTTNTDSTAKDENKVASPKTGDASKFGYMFLLVASAICMVVVLNRKKFVHKM